MKTIKKFGWLIIFLAVLTACNYPSANPAPATPTTNLVQTAAAATIAAIHTEQAPAATEGAIEVLPTDPSENQQPTNTLAPEEPTAEPTEDVLPTNTPWPTYTPLPTHTPYPTNTPTPTVPCNQMTFIQDITIPDGTWMRPEQKFTKIWEIQNTGTCTWDSTYSIVYGDSGGKLGAPSSKVLPDTPVEPGEKIQISMAFTSPDTAGDYTSVWKLQPDGGDKFGKMTVEIDVDGNDSTFYFADYLCSAVWRSDAGVLPCPNEKNNKDGSMYIDKNPTFETGYTDNENAIIMIPEQTTNGEIVGSFFYIKMPSTTAHFRTILGCTDGNDSCDVDVYVYYRVKGSDTSYLVNSWDEKFDNSIQNIDIDLAGFSLEDKEVEFTFNVRAAGPYTDDEIFFLQPRIEIP